MYVHRVTSSFSKHADLPRCLLTASVFPSLVFSLSAFKRPQRRCPDTLLALTPLRKAGESCQGRRSVRSPLLHVSHYLFSPSCFCLLGFLSILRNNTAHSFSFLWQYGAAGEVSAFFVGSVDHNLRRSWKESVFVVFGDISETVG